ncbi:MAG: hypothetical protein K6F86_00485 [Lachnospiraceae bacterium]|nr:hypothetical protein [Lachnospiraceae bacterium]
MTDERINELLYATRTGIHPDDTLIQRTKNMITAKANGKEHGMKRTGIKKALVFAAVFCLLSSTIVVAHGLKKASVMRNTAGEFTEYADIAKAEKKAGIEIKAPESFSNGYAFKEASVLYCEDLGDNKETIQKYEGISVEYTKDGSDIITLDAQPAQFFDMVFLDKPQNKTSIDGIDVRYYSHAYKGVPTDYVLTEEDIRREKEEGLQIVYGAKEPYERQMCNCMWIQDGIGYDLLCVTATIPAEKMYEMAEELIRK